jgi:hypothetical protein
VKLVVSGDSGEPGLAVRVIEAMLLAQGLHLFSLPLLLRCTGY